MCGKVHLGLLRQLWKQTLPCLFDHADIYTRGKSEPVFGDVLKASPGLREQIVLQRI
jgi:predicted oxidoreductase